MKSASMKVVRFDADDVIATSGYLLTGVNDGTAGNVQFQGEPLSSFGYTKFYYTVTYGSLKVNGSFKTSTAIARDDETLDSSLNGIYEFHNAGDETVVGGPHCPDGIVRKYNSDGWYKVSN